MSSVSIGFHGKYQNGNWIPVTVTLANNGTDFSGKVSVNAPTSSGTTAFSIYQTPVSLPSHSQKQITLYVPFNTISSNLTTNFTVNLLDNNGGVVTSRVAAPGSISPNDLYIGILNDQNSELDAINSVASLLNMTSSIYTEPLNAAMIPTSVEALNNFDMLVLDNFTASTLSKDQLATLQSWVSQGGTLITVGGPEWQRTLSALPANLLPVSVTGTATLPPGTHLLPMGWPSQSSNHADDTVQSTVAVSTATARNGSTVLLSSDTTPLIAQSAYGQGTVYYLAFDPTLAPIAGWPQAKNLWEGLILRSLGDVALSSSSGSTMASTGGLLSYTNVQQVLQSLIPNTAIATWLILVLLLGYVLVLGPLRLLIVQHFKKRDWSWRIVLSTILVFTLLSYGLALQQKGTSIVSSSISVYQLARPDGGGSLAHNTTYMGIFVPSQGDYHVYVPGSNMVQPADQTLSTTGNAQPSTRTTITSSDTGTDVDLQGVDTWTLRTIVAQNDRHTQGGIVSHLALQQNTITGTVTNTLPYALDDTYILLDSDYIALGHLDAGQTRAVHLVLSRSLNTASAIQTSLADQIISDHNITSGSYAYYGSSQPPDEMHRRMMVLSTLGGNVSCWNGTSCPNTHGFLAKNGRYINASLSGTSSINDPLLLSGAPATLIGWANTPGDQNDQVTVNGNQPLDTQETFVRAPLDIAISGPVQIPPSLIDSQVVDVEQAQQGSIQEVGQGIYAMTTGSMTFDFTLPAAASMQNSTFTINGNAANTTNGYIPSQITGTTNTINHVQTHLYNWQTDNWDNYTFNQNAVLTVNHAQPYIGPGGRILLQVANADNTVGTTIFSKPEIQLQGVVSH